MEEKARNLDAVRDNVLKRFRKLHPLYDFFILDQRDVDFRAYVFARRDEDLQCMRRRGVDQDIIAFVYEELERAGRGGRNEIDVAFEFDSDDRVKADFGGNYFLRLRQ